VSPASRLLLAVVLGVGAAAVLLLGGLYMPFMVFAGSEEGLRQTWASVEPSLIVGLIPLAMLGLIVLLLFLLLAALLARSTYGVQRETGGVFALTFASVILLSGLWAVYLSPTSTYTEFKGRFDYNPTIEPFGFVVYPFAAEAGDLVTGNAGSPPYWIEPEPKPCPECPGVIEGNRSDIVVIEVNSSDIIWPPPERGLISVYIRDPRGNVVWSNLRVVNAYFSIRAVETGIYQVEIRNLSPRNLDCYLGFSIEATVRFRPLEPLGSWLSLVSLPIFGLGAWAVGTRRRLPPPPTP